MTCTARSQKNWRGAGRLPEIIFICKEGKAFQAEYSMSKREIYGEPQIFSFDKSLRLVKNTIFFSQYCQLNSKKDTLKYFKAYYLLTVDHKPLLGCKGSVEQRRERCNVWQTFFREPPYIQLSAKVPPAASSVSCAQFRHSLYHCEMKQPTDLLPPPRTYSLRTRDRSYLTSHFLYFAQCVAHRSLLKNVF